MPTRTIRARVHGKNLEPVEDLELPDGSEVTVIVEIPAARPPARERELPCRNLGLIGPITRDVIYADIG